MGQIRPNCTSLEIFVHKNKMALKFAANLSFTFLEYGDFLERYQVAKNAGNVREFALKVFKKMDSCRLVYISKEYNANLHKLNHLININISFLSRCFVYFEQLSERNR